VQPNGKPLRVFFFNEEGASAQASSPESYQAAEAATDYINKNLGGVGGRPFKLIHCASLGTPDSDTNCANKAVDAHPDVVIKGVEVASATAVPIIASAGIPYVTLQSGTVELTNPDSFVLSGGNAAQWAPVAEYAKQMRYRRIGVIYTNVTSLSSSLDGTVSNLFKQNGVDYTSVPVAINTGDLSPAYSAVVAKHADAVFMVGSANQCAALLKARTSLADTTPLFMSASCNVSNVLSSVPSSVTNNTIFASLDTSAVPDDPDTKVYRTVMRTYQPSANTGSFAPTGFAAVMDFYRAMLTASNPKALDAKSVKATLASSKDVKLFMGGGKTFSCSVTYFASAPSVCTGASFLVSYANGDYKLVGGYDAAKLLAGIS
jgi:branched-chain amino acid transport system substrate-binding protein